jgi:hypothetical protein
MSSNMMEEVMEQKKPDDRGSKAKPDTQNVPLGIGAGVGVAIVGTGLWIVIAQKYQITWMSVVIAFGIASAMKYAGKFKVMWPGIISAFLSIIAAVIGNLATAIVIVSKRGSTPGEIIAQLDIATAISFLKAIGGPMGIIFYLVVLYVGFWFAFKHEPKKPVELPD